MKTQGIKGTWNKLPFWVKAIIIVVLILIVLRLFSRFKSFIDTIVHGSKDKGVEAGYAALGEEPSYSEVEYKNMADRLETAMDGAGTDYDEVFAVMDKLENNIDAVKLNQAYGIREYSVIGITFRSSLLEWLEGDLSDDRMSMIWDSLETKGITYRFT